jgi:hypothetical protein
VYVVYGYETWSAILGEEHRLNGGILELGAGENVWIYEREVTGP